MKHLFFIITLSVCMTSNLYAQMSNDSVNQSTINNSVVVQSIDKTQLDRIDKIENNLTMFYKANRKSQFFIYLGTAMTITSALYRVSYNSSSSYSPSTGSNLLAISGFLCTITGGLIYLDSYKYLNFRKKGKNQERIKNTQKNFGFDL